MVCKNCGKEFLPSKQDKRIVYCSTQCRTNYRRSINYMENYYSENKENKWYERQKNQEYKEKKNAARRKRYKEDIEYRENAKRKAKEYNLKHPDSKLRHHLSYDFGISLEDYNTKLESQNKRCAICGSVGNQRYKYRKLFVDHNHKTGAVRGLLCDRCNFLIGWADDDIGILENAIKYLEDYQ